MSYRIEKRPDGGVVCVFEGVLTPRENERARLEMAGGDYQNFARIPYLIADHSNITGASHTSDDIRRLASSGKKIFRENNPDVIIALVVPKDFMFGLGRIWHTYFGEDERINLFRSLEEAERWIQDTLAGTAGDGEQGSP